MKVKLRNFLLSDLEQVMKIEKDSFAFPYSESYFKKIYRKYPQGFIVAQENRGKIIGYVVFQSTINSGEMISLAIEPDYRKKGIGTKLANFAIEHFKNREVNKITSHVRTKNKAGILFHRSLGFKKTKTIKNYYSNGDNAFLMIKEI